MDNRFMVIEIPIEVLVEILAGNRLRKVELPDDYKIVHISDNWDYRVPPETRSPMNMMVITISSETFEVVKPGNMVPEFKFHGEILN